MDSSASAPSGVSNSPGLCRRSIGAIIRHAPLACEKMLWFQVGTLSRTSTALDPARNGIETQRVIFLSSAYGRAKLSFHRAIGQAPCVRNSLRHFCLLDVNDTNP